MNTKRPARIPKATYSNATVFTYQQNEFGIAFFAPKSAGFGGSFVSRMDAWESSDTLPWRWPPGHQESSKHNFGCRFSKRFTKLQMLETLDMFFFGWSKASPLFGLWNGKSLQPLRAVFGGWGSSFNYTNSKLHMSHSNVSFWIFFSFKWFWKLVPSFEYLKVRAPDESMEMFTAAQSDPNMGDLHLDRPGVTRSPLGCFFHTFCAC